MAKCTERWLKGWSEEMVKGPDNKGGTGERKTGRNPGGREIKRRLGWMKVA